MDIKIFLLALTLFWKSSQATVCYECKTWTKLSSIILEDSCAGGKFNNTPTNETKASVEKDCGSNGCFKLRLHDKETGQVLYERGCADAPHHSDKCETLADSNGTRTECYCRTNHCNSAVTHTSQAIIALVATAIMAIMA